MLAAASFGGLQILDVSDPARPVPVGTLNTPGDLQDVVLSGTYALGAVDPSELWVVDLSDGVTAAGPRVLVADDLGGLRVAEARPPTALTEVGRYVPPCRAWPTA